MGLFSVVGFHVLRVNRRGRRVAIQDQCIPKTIHYIVLIFTHFHIKIHCIVTNRWKKLRSSSTSATGGTTSQIPSVPWIVTTSMISGIQPTPGHGNIPNAKTALLPVIPRNVTSTYARNITSIWLAKSVALDIMCPGIGCTTYVDALRLQRLSTAGTAGNGIATFIRYS